MNPESERELVRLLHGELPAERAAALRARLEREPELQVAYRRLEALWTGLAAPPASDPPADFTAAVMARLRGQPAGAPPAALSWSLAPAWARATAVAALLAGVALGAGAVRGLERPVASEESGLAGETTLAESYWQALDEAEESRR